MILVTALVFIAILLLLVLVHEWGHYIAAKKAGCNVEEFGFGFPPRIFSVMKWGTKWSFNLLPIGGFVKIEGEDMEEEDPTPTSFASKSATWRIIILSGGVFMNVVLAAVLLAIQSGIGTPTLVTESNASQLTDHKTYILDVADGSPAEQAELREYDRIEQIGSIANPSIDDIQTAIDEAAGTSIPVHIERQGQHFMIELTPRLNPPEGQGALGVSLASTGLQKSPWWQAPWHGIKRTWELTVAIIYQFGLIIQRVATEGSAGESLTGPIGIAVYTNEATQQGLSYILEFAALISINLAIVNILPLPALDGGRILFVIIEKLAGRRLPRQVESYIHTAGFVFLIGLMILITIKDARRFF